MEESVKVGFFPISVELIAVDDDQSAKQQLPVAAVLFFSCG